MNVDIIGFYIPVGQGHVEKVNCTWSDHEVYYYIETKRLPKEAVLEEIKSAHTWQLEKFKQSIHTRSKMLTLPLTEEYVLEYFGEGARQMQTGASIVILHIKKKCTNTLYPVKKVIG